MSKRGHRGSRKARFKMANKKEEEKLKQDLQKLKEELQQAELSEVTGAQLTDNQLDIVQDRLYKMIDYTVKRHDWYVDQCHRLLQIGLALIATAAAIAAILVKLENLARAMDYLAWAFALSLFGTGLLLVYLYNSYLSGVHPYRKVVDIHSWYFAYRFPQPLDPNLSRSPEKAKQQVGQEKKYIAEYFARFLPHSKDRSSLIREDIEQVAILLILQRYRAQQVKAMAQSLFRGLLFTFIFPLLIFGSLFLHARQPNAGTSGLSMPTTSAPAAAPSAATAPPAPSPAPTKAAPTKTVPVKPADKRPHPGTQPPP